MTAEGRNAIEVIQAEVKRVEDAEVVVGDTDSVMFKLAGRTLKKAEEIGTARSPPESQSYCVTTQRGARHGNFVREKAMACCCVCVWLRRPTPS